MFSCERRNLLKNEQNNIISTHFMHIYLDYYIYTQSCFMSQRSPTSLHHKLHNNMKRATKKKNKPISEHLISTMSLPHQLNNHNNQHQLVSVPFCRFVLLCLLFKKKKKTFSYRYAFKLHQIAEKPIHRSLIMLASFEPFKGNLISYSFPKKKKKT